MPHMAWKHYSWRSLYTFTKCQGSWLGGRGQCYSVAICANVEQVATRKPIHESECFKTLKEGLNTQTSCDTLYKVFSTLWWTYRLTPTIPLWVPALWEDEKVLDVNSDSILNAEYLLPFGGLLDQLNRRASCDWETRSCFILFYNVTICNHFCDSRFPW